MTDMFSGTVSDKGNFNQDLSAWDVSEVTSMSNMFKHTASFDRSLSSWDVGKVVDIGCSDRGRHFMITFESGDSHVYYLHSLHKLTCV